MAKAQDYSRVMATANRKPIYISPELHKRLMALHDETGRSERRVWQTVEELMSFALSVKPAAEAAICGSELESN